MKMIVALTGHRPEQTLGEDDVRTKFRKAFENSRPDVVICGGAAGVDLWGADEARLQGIEVWLAKPWAGHGPRAGDESLYHTIFTYAGRVVNVVEQEDFPGNWSYQRRNEWMVDHATHVLAYMIPNLKSGGTYNCVKYARGKKPVRNIYD